MLDYLALSDGAFTKFVDGLSSEAYRSIFNSDPDFADRINGGTAWQEHRDQKDLEAYVTAELNKKRDRLNKELCSGRGLSTPSWIWLDQRNLATVSLSVPPSVKETRPIYDEFNKKRGPFTEEERGVLLTLAQQCSGFGRVLDLRDPKSWECAFAVGIASGKIGLTRTQPEVKHEPSMAEKIGGMVAEPTPEEKKVQERHDRFNKVVGTWVDNGVTKNETAATVDKMDSETYKRFIVQTKGKLEQSFSNLLHPVPMGVK